jgi:ATP-dependent Clp protease ATP-binding subunit ClpA
MFECYSDRARRTIFMARVLAGRRGAESIEMRDLAEALVREDRGEYAIILDMDPDARHSEPSENPAPGFFPPAVAGRILHSMKSPAVGVPVAQSIDMPLADDAKQVLHQAYAISRRLHHEQVEPLHLLAAVLDQPATSTAHLLTGHGVTRAQIDEALGAE